MLNQFRKRKSKKDKRLLLWADAVVIAAAQIILYSNGYTLGAIFGGVLLWGGVFSFRFWILRAGRYVKPYLLSLSLISAAVTTLVFHIQVLSRNVMQVEEIFFTFLGLIPAVNAILFTALLLWLDDIRNILGEKGALL